MEIAINTHAPASDVAEEAWFKSSYSNDTGGACVEVADLATQVLVRDSKAKQGPALAVPAATWGAFVEALKASSPPAI
ncbi:DUF397 domain-containing protein [Streptomyces sp. NPDC101150]|uniref:DUF397 domain-containing protein n=1 Tax=Streptomyces sp. NPDC101150 TaxID=3366114 RepID=UPI003816CB78